MNMHAWCWFYSILFICKKSFWQWVAIESLTTHKKKSEKNLLENEPFTKVWMKKIVMKYISIILGAVVHVMWVFFSKSKSKTSVSFFFNTVSIAISWVVAGSGLVAGLICLLLAFLMHATTKHMGNHHCFCTDVENCNICTYTSGPQLMYFQTKVARSS